MKVRRELAGSFRVQLHYWRPDKISLTPTSFSRHCFSSNSSHIPTHSFNPRSNPGAHPTPLSLHYRLPPSQ